ncbi:MAG: hypothetical protein CMJ89_15900 [Planctomycetes bacterium]|jgi:Rps23 Pro-64 3,4-dihydroxylase Tpa1-like proline 4-hydroxylase|nr:hypothetical protein [Planctomycetota bacterium]
MDKTNRIDIWTFLAPFDTDRIEHEFKNSGPLRHFAIDDFLHPDFFATVAKSFPSYESAVSQGQSFRTVNEARKVQITEEERFLPPLQLLNAVLASAAFRSILSQITGINELHGDPELHGGGIHIMDSGARLDVHVDFNILRERQLYRRLNLLVFASHSWRPEWGGAFELWDPDVGRRLYEASPLPNRCVVFETSETSFHGVTPVRSPRHVARNSFATYYYTKESAEALEGKYHSTIFRARPNEWLRRTVMMPMEDLARRISRSLRRTP